MPVTAIGARQRGHESNGGHWLPPGPDSPGGLTIA
jgi:hypothetical protein